MSWLTTVDLTPRMAAGDTTAAVGLDAVETALVAGYVIVLVVLLAGAVYMVWRLTRELTAGDTPRIESHWGGLGGGLGGWQISRSLTYVLGAITFASLFTLAFTRGAEQLRAQRDAGNAASQRAAPPGGPADSATARDRANARDNVPRTDSAGRPQNTGEATTTTG